MTIPSKAFEYYIQGFRLHNLMTKRANLQAQDMFERATGEDPEFARAWGHRAYTLLIAWVSGWAAGPKPPQGVWDFSQEAFRIDRNDYDVLWTKAAVDLYTAKFAKGSAAAFTSAVGSFAAVIKAAKAQAIDFNLDGLRVDWADALFFAGERGLPDVNQAIKITQQAIGNLNPNHPKRFLWTLGWAYYERGYFTGKADDYAQSLGALLQIGNPQDTVIKNIIATYAALDWIKPAQRLARDFLGRNPGYALAIEDRWPYRDPKRLESWKGHLGKAGLK